MSGDRTPGQASAPSRHGVAVGLCTYKRLPSLMRTLEHTAQAIAAWGGEARIIVVDNDGRDPQVAASVADFARRSGIATDCIAEPTPGISAARNAVFARADALGLRFMAMLDDDEWPSPGWLAALLDAQRATGAAVVGGPVSPVFPPEAAHLQRYARFWSVQAQRLAGRTFVFCSCNFLVDLARLATEPRPLFDEQFGLSGGGDTVFFRKLFFNGFDMAWREEALLYEEVPPARASLRWMRQRRYRVGNHAVHWERINSPVRTLAKTLGLTLRLPIYPLLRREPEMPWVGWLLEYDKLRGRYASHLGSKFMEYARPQAAGSKACG